MKYIVWYWAANLEALTGFNKLDEITEDQVLELMRAQKVNIMIHHVKASKHQPESKSYCYIDDINHRFQSR